MKKALFTLLLTFFSFISSYNALTNITINGTKLVPTFDKNITNYNVFVSSKTEIITINVTSEDGEVVTGAGSKSLKKGLNEMEIKVYINEELQKVYTLNIVRGDIEFVKSDGTLKSLTIKNHEIDFDSDTYEYIIDASVLENNLDIHYETTNPASSVKLTGNTLNKNENIIKLEITSEDKTTTKEYIIKVNKEIKEHSKETNTSIFDKAEFSKTELKLIITAIVTIGLIILGILFYFMFIKKRKRYCLKIKRINLSILKQLFKKKKD